MINKDKGEGHFLFVSNYKNRINDLDRSFYKILLSKRRRSGKKRESNIFFVHPYAEVPEKFEKLECSCLMFDFNFMCLHTEHKELLFKSPYIAGNTAFSAISINDLEWLELDAIFSQIVKEIKSEDMHSKKIVVSYLNIIFSLCDRLNSEFVIIQLAHHYTNLLIVGKFRHLLFSNKIKYRSVDYYSKALYLTSNYLNEVLKSVTGKNASTTIIEFVILESKYQLIHTIKSSKEVAEELGFSSQSYFTRFFKKNVGLTPMEWFNSQVFA
ncbi:MAG: helix-turn-helix domain-containing protein [Saprospiraceae bacterium]